MSDIMDQLRAARDAADPAAFHALVPFARHMGITAICPAGELLGAMRYRDHLIGNPLLPALHGGGIGALMESTAVFQVWMESGTVVLPKTINFTIEYLRPGKPVDTYCRGEITKFGRRVVNVQMRAWQGDRDKPIAAATAHFLIKTESR